MDIDDASPQFVETLTGLFDAYYGFVGAEAYVILGFVALLWLVETGEHGLFPLPERLPRHRAPES